MSDESSTSQWRQCPECQSAKLYTTAIDATGAYGPNFLPGLGGFIQAAEVRVVVCGSCGLMRLYALQEACAKLERSDRWARI